VTAEKTKAKKNDQSEQNAETNSGAIKAPSTSMVSWVLIPELL